MNNKFSLKCQDPISWDLFCWYLFIRMARSISHNLCLDSWSMSTTHQGVMDSRARVTYLLLTKGLQHYIPMCLTKSTLMISWVQVVTWQMHEEGYYAGWILVICSFSIWNVVVIRRGSQLSHLLHNQWPGHSCTDVLTISSLVGGVIGNLVIRGQVSKCHNRSLLKLFQSIKRNKCLKSCFYLQ